MIILFNNLTNKFKMIFQKLAKYLNRNKQYMKTMLPFIIKFNSVLGFKQYYNKIKIQQTKKKKS